MSLVTGSSKVNIMPRKDIVLVGVLLLEVAMEASAAGILGTNPLIGPCDILIRKIEMCPKKLSGTNGFRLSNVKTFHSKDGTNDFIMDANITLDFDLDDKLMAVTNYAAFTNRGTWKPNLSNMAIYRACSSFKAMAGKAWQSVVVAFYGEDHPCPLPAIKTRRFRRNITVGDQDIILHEFMYGKYRANVQYTDMATHSVKGCMRVTVDVIPKKS